MSTEELRDLVMSIVPPDPGRDTWIKMGMICHHQERGSLDGLDIWHDWSNLGNEHPELYGSPASYSEIEYQWHSFKKEPIKGRRLTTHKTLRYWAKKGAPCNEAIFVDTEYDLEETCATEYVIDGFIAEGIFVLSGQSGIGKTTLLLPLAALAAHICAHDHPLKPILRRPVLYLTEDKKQAVRIFSGLRNHCDVQMSAAEMNQWFKIRETHRMNKEEIAQLIHQFAMNNKKYMKDINGKDVLIPVLIVADTVAASLDLEDENNNSEVSKFISKIKSACSETGASLWLIAHISKAMNRSDVSDMSARGASAFGADANGTGFVITDDKVDEDKRFLILGKKRYEVDFNEVSFATQRYEIPVKNRLGQSLTESYRIGSIEKSSEQNRKVASQRAQLTRDENKVLNEILQSGQIYLPKTLVGTITGMATGNAYQRLGGILAKLVADQRLEIISAKTAKAEGANVSANTKEVYRIKPSLNFDV
jgi:RecA-family ATPase